MRWTKRLRDLGILGLNARNAEFILPYNKRRFYPRVDDKLETKRRALEKGIHVPDLYQVIEIERQNRNFSTLLAPYQDFVLKPAKGSGGDGIWVITGKRQGKWVKSSGSLVSEDDLQFHVSNILSGMYSLGGTADTAFFEYRVKIDSVFEKVSYGGVPDVRVILFRGIPVMAMLRLPTQASDGKANLHQGAVGAGVDLDTGLTTNGVCLNMQITQHPDTGESIRDIQIPTWDDFLILASKCYGLAELDYLGVDMVLDAQRGPLVLELNARPGLSIQICNRIGLKQRLNVVKNLTSIPPYAEDRVALMREHLRSAQSN